MTTPSGDIRATVAQVVNRILTDSGRPTRQFEDDDTLTGTIGLDSLDLAVLVVGMEQVLGIDPFRSGAAPVATFGKLVSLYEASINGSADKANEGSAG